MAKRKSTTTRRTRLVPRRSTRIVIPQPVDRPYQLRQRDLVRRDKVTENPWWFTVHRQGPRRPEIGEDPREARAIPRSQLRGTLPERIVYKVLVQDFHLVPDVDFDFQSSQDGGRIELGGIVADFLFPIMRIVIPVQGPTHRTWLRSKKDNEQVDILAEMGYTVFPIEEETCYQASELDRTLRGILLSNEGSRGPDESDFISSSMLLRLEAALIELRAFVGSI